MTRIIVGRGRSKATQRMEINDPTVSREHCWLTDNGDGTYTLENKSVQGTFVNGRQVVRTTVTPDSMIRLSDTTTVRVADLLPLERVVRSQPRPTVSPQPTVPEYSIKPLMGVWEEYHDRQLEIKKRQRDTNLLRSASPLFTMGSGTLATMARTMGWGDAFFGLTLILTMIGLCLMVYSFWKAANDRSITEGEEAEEAFQSKYVCPNPGCRHFMGKQPYKLLRQNKLCPWCKCKFTEQ